MEKRTFMRLISVFLCVLMLVGTIPTAAFATQNDELTELPEAISVSWISPQCQESLQLPDESEQPPVSFFEEPVYHTEPATVAAELKAAMMYRAECIQVYYEIPIGKFTNEGLGELSREIFEIAFAHNGMSNEGDYLRWNCAGRRIGARAFDYSADKTCYRSVVTITLAYFDDYEQEEAIDAEIADLLTDLNPTGTDYEKLKTAYDWICANIVYDNEHLDDETYLLKHSAYAALVEKSAVCQGYALLLYRLALEMGIDCRIISGIGNGGYHAWNIIKLGDLYYNLDSTWDSQWKQAGWDYQYFLTSDENFVKHSRDDEFATEEFYAAYPMSPENYDRTHVHTYTDVVTEPNCAGQGYTTHTCTVCGGSYVDSYVEATAHTEVTDEAKEATCTESGLTEGKSCSVCGEVLVKQQIIPAVGHSWCAADCESPRTCSVCAATEGAALGHDWADATCTDPSTCTTCGKTQGNALGHLEVTVSGKEATCTESGLTEGKSCSVCGEVLVKQQVIPAVGHSWCAADCESPRTCAACRVTDGKPAGHSYDSGVDGSCNTCGINREDTEKRTVMHMFRMYDPNSGEHFYTGSEEERENLVAAGWVYEGVGFTFSRTTGLPVYRLYDPLTGEHLYTMDEAEKSALMSQGWNFEGIAFNSAYDTEVPQYRLHNHNASRGAYHFTASTVERDYLISLGWEYQGIGFYSSWK